MLQHLLSGFAAALTPAYLAYAFAGCVLGTLIGVLPGLGPAAGTAILIPLTFKLDPTGAIIMLSAIYYGAMYGGTITSVLINVPGEAASVITCIDGHAMAKQGRAGTALGIAAIGSFIGGTVATIALVVVAPPLAKMALSFGPPEFFALMLFGLCLVSGLAGKSMLAALLMTVLGLLLAMIGIDPVRGAPRFAFEIPDLYDGIGFIPVVMGLFGISEILLSAEAPLVAATSAKLSGLLPSREEWRRSNGAIWRGTGIGFALGLIPGIGAIVPTFMAYIAEKRLSKTPERFGNGAIEGVAGPESANNAAAGGAFIPLMTLGIPPNVVMALLMGAFIIDGLQPGPLMMSQNPALFWAIVVSMYIGNVMLLVLNLPLVGMWAQLLRLPYNVLFPLIVLFSIVGVYCSSNNVFDVYVMIAFGILGYLMRKTGYEPAPLVLAFVLGPMLENNLRKALILSQGELTTFLTRPISAACLLFAAVLLVFPLLPSLRRKREAVALDEGA